MRHFPHFLSTFEAARTVFEVSGRQKSDISTGFCLLSVPRDPVSENLVDKNQTSPLIAPPLDNSPVGTDFSRKEVLQGTARCFQHWIFPRKAILGYIQYPLF